MAYPLDAYYSRIYKRYDLVNRLFTFGLDQSWRKEAARQCIRFNPEAVLDLCCGTGDLTILLARNAEAKVSVTGYDRNRYMLEAARKKSMRKNLQGIQYIQGDASQMPFADNSFDCITIGFGFRNLIYDNPRSFVHISEMNRVLKKGGKLFILESAIPENRLIRFFYTCYLYMALIPIGYMLSGDRKAYRYLAQSSANFFTTDEIFRMLSEKGFTNMEKKVFFIGAASLIIAEKI